LSTTFLFLCRLLAREVHVRELSYSLQLSLEESNMLWTNTCNFKFLKIMIEYILDEKGCNIRR